MSLQNVNFPAGVSFAFPHIPLNNLARRQDNQPSMKEVQDAVFDLGNLVIKIGTDAPTCLNTIQLGDADSESCKDTPRILNSLTSCMTMTASEKPTVQSAVARLECICDILASDDLETTLGGCAEDICEGDEKGEAEDWVKRVKEEGGAECKRVTELVKDAVGDNDGEDENPNDGKFTTTIVTTINGTPTTVVYGVATAPPAEVTTTTAVVTDADGEEMTTVIVITRDGANATSGFVSNFPEPTPEPTDITNGEEEEEEEDGNDEDGEEQDENEEGDNGGDSAGVALTVKKSLLWAAVGLPVILAAAM